METEQLTGPFGDGISGILLISGQSEPITDSSTEMNV